jgi:hypothetical protein
MVSPAIAVDRYDAMAATETGTRRARQGARTQNGGTGTRRGYNQNAVRLIPGEVERVHGQSAVNGLIRQPDFEQALNLAENTGFSPAWHSSTPKCVEAWRKRLFSGPEFSL